MKRIDHYLATINKVLLWFVFVVLWMQYNAILNIEPRWLVGIAVGWSILHILRWYSYLRQRTGQPLTILLTAMVTMLMLVLGYLAIN